MCLCDQLFEVRLEGSADVTRVVLRGTLSAPSLGMAGEPIEGADYGFRANPWRHLSRLARAIETQGLGIVIPDEEVRRRTPE